MEPYTQGGSPQDQSEAKIHRVQTDLIPDEGDISGNKRFHTSHNLLRQGQHQNGGRKPSCSCLFNTISRGMAQGRQKEGAESIASPTMYFIFFFLHVSTYHLVSDLMMLLLASTTSNFVIHIIKITHFSLEKKNKF